MARQLKLPVARILSKDAQSRVEDVMAALGPSVRISLIDVDLLRKSKTYAKLKAQAEGWSDDQCIDYLLSMMAEGPV